MGFPIQLNLYEDRLELQNPGGIYGRLSMDELGRTQTDSRNPALVTAMEVLGKTENRFSGIPTIRRAMAQRHQPEPVFENSIGTFKVSSSNYALRRYLDPLVRSGAIRMTIPEKPRSHSQRYITAERP